MTNRADVYDAINSERDYQDALWGDSMRAGKHTTTEFLVYIRDYTEEALHRVSRLPDEVNHLDTLDSLRKIATLAVAAMEQHGALPRSIEDYYTAKERHEFE